MWWHAKDRRRKLLRKPFPPDWESVADGNVWHWRRLSEEQRVRLRQGVRILVAEKNWEGCRGLEVSAEMMVTIAAQACLLLLGLEHDYFSRVPTILVYPSGFASPEPALGQTMYRGPVILAWDAVLEEGRDPSHGWNVVIHEFAHQLDALDGDINGIPELADEKRWWTVVTAEMHRMRRALRKGRPTFLGDYAGTNEAELFAVASERFFTVPNDLQHHHPDLFAVLADYYALDPRQWFQGASDH